MNVMLSIKANVWNTKHDSYLHHRRATKHQWCRIGPPGISRTMSPWTLKTAWF